MTTFYCNNIADSLRVDVSTGAYVLLTPSQETADGTNVNINSSVKIPITIANGTASFSHSVVDCKTQSPNFLYTVQIISQGAVVYNQTGVPITGANYNLAAFVPGSAGGTSGVTIPTLQTNGTNNADQLLLNLVAGSNITLSSDSSGDVTITGAASGVWGQITGTLFAQTDLESALTTLTNSVTTETTRAETAEALLAPLTSAHLVTPLLGTPTSGNLVNCTFPTLNQSTSGTSAGLTGTPNISVGTITASGLITANGVLVSPVTDSSTAFAVKSQAQGINVVAIDSQEGGNGLVVTGLIGGGLSMLVTGIPWFQSQIAAHGGISVGYTANSISGVVSLAGGISGAATIAAPAVAGTITNPITVSNSVSLAAGTSLSIGTAVALGNTLTTYDSIATTGMGVAAQFATVDSTGLVASTGTVTLYAVPSTGAGQYRISGNAKITHTGTSPTIGPLTVTYTDPDGTVCAMVVPSQNSAGTVSNGGNASNSTTQTGVMLFSDVVLNCKASTNIQYSFPVSGTIGTGAWNLHLKCEALG